MKKEKMWRKVFRGSVATILLYFAYTETGPATTIILAVSYIYSEINNRIQELVVERLRRIDESL